MTRWVTFSVLALLGGCTSSSESNSSSNVAPDAFQRDMNNVLEVSKGKECGPAPLGGWPPRRVKGGIVNDAERAKALGLVYLVSMYGKQVVTLPLFATLKNGVWTVMDAGPGKGAIGGERVILMCQSSGAVLLTYRTQ